MIAITSVAWPFASDPQVGSLERLTFAELAARLATTRRGTDKRAPGAFSPAEYRGNVRRKDQLITAHALVVDLDGNAPVELVASAVQGYRAIVLETFSSMPGNPRSRLILPLSEPVDAATYEAAHAIARRKLAAHGFAVDNGAKDACRLSFWPVRRPGETYAFLVNEGRPFDARACIARHPPPRKPPPPPPPRHRDRYVQGALSRAASAIAGATPGERHAELVREVFCLARFDLQEHEIASALRASWIAAAGESRVREFDRSVRDAVRAQRGR